MTLAARTGKNAEAIRAAVVPTRRDSSNSPQCHIFNFGISRFPLYPFALL
jgi:hypothetical protein